MKMVCIFLSITFFSTISLQAQVTVNNRPMVLGSQPALVIKLKGADPKFVESTWKEYTKSYGKVTKVKGSKESVIEGVHVRDIGKGDVIDVYSYATELADGAELAVWFDRGGSFLEAKDAEYKTAEMFLTNFAYKVNVDMTAIDLEEQLKKLSKLESDSAKLQKENQNLHKIIDDANARIAQAEIDIPANLQAQEAAQSDITNQKAVVESVKDNPDEFKAQQKVMSKAESNYTKLRKEEESLHKVVTDSKAKIKQAELDIEANLSAQKSNSAAISDQRVVASLVEKKLEEARKQKAE